MSSKRSSTISEEKVVTTQPINSKDLKTTTEESKKSNTTNVATDLGGDFLEILKSIVGTEEKPLSESLDSSEPLKVPVNEVPYLETIPTINAFKILCLNQGDIIVKLKNKLLWSVHSGILLNNLNSNLPSIQVTEDAKAEDDEKKQSLRSKKDKKLLESKLSKSKKLDLSEYPLKVSAQFLVSLYCLVVPKDTPIYYADRHPKDKKMLEECPNINKTECVENILKPDNISLYKLYEAFGMRGLLNYIETNLIGLETNPDPIFLLKKYQSYKSIFPKAYNLCLFILSRTIKEKTYCYDDIPAGEHKKPKDHTDKKCCHNITATPAEADMMAYGEMYKCQRDYCCTHSSIETYPPNPNKNKNTTRSSVIGNKIEECNKYLKTLDSDDLIAYLDMSTFKYTDISALHGRRNKPITKDFVKAKLLEFFHSYMQTKKIDLKITDLSNNDAESDDEYVIRPLN